MSTAVALGLQLVHSLVDLSFLELPDDLHVLLADGVVLEVVELGRVVGEIQQVDLPFVFGVELLDVLLHVEVVAAYRIPYCASRTILSVIYFLECSLAHLSMFCCLMCMVFS
jgi:hypothetical protein